MDNAERIKSSIDCWDVLEYHRIDTGNRRKNIHCPFPGHEDRNPSFGVYDNGSKCKCHGCGKGGDCIALEEELSGKSFQICVDVLSEVAGINLNKKQPSKPTGDAVQRFAAIRKHQASAYRHLGVEADKYELRLPMRDDAGDITGWRRRKANNEPFRIGKDKPKCLTTQGGHNGLIYNYEKVQSADGLLITEGGPDAAAAISAGFEGAVIGIPGSTPGKKCLKYLAKLASGKTVILAPDPDEAGEKLRNKLGRLLRDAGARVSFIPPVGEDLDERIKAGESMAELLESAIDWQPPREEGDLDGVKGLRSALWDVSQENLPAAKYHRKCAETVVEWLHTRGRFYFHKQHKDFAGVMFFDAQRKLLLPVQGDSFLAWLAGCMGINRAEQTFKFTAKAAETEGLSERSTGIIPERFFTSRDSAFYLSNGPGQIVKIDKTGYSKVDNGTDGVLFMESGAMPKWTLCEPVNPFENCALFKDMAAASRHGKLLTELWTIAMPADPANKPPLCFTSPAGGGKTATVRGIFRLYGIPENIDKVKKDGENDFWTAINAGGLYCLDNADSKTPWLADSMAAAATGGTVQKRKLYTDNDIITLHSRAWLAVTSLNPTFASDAGLADRLLVNRLERRTGETAENELFSEIESMRDAGLSFIAETLSKVSADTEPTPGGLNARHPDFAALSVKIGRAIGREDEAVSAMRAAELDKSLFNVQNHWIGSILLETIRKANFQGGSGSLLDRLKKTDPGLEGKLSVQRLPKQLDRLWPHLETILNAERWRDSHSKSWVFNFENTQ